MIIKGLLRKDFKTKELVKRLCVNDIALINHPDLDEMAALALIKTKPKMVINASMSITGKYPNSGPLKLLEAGIPIVDNMGLDFFNQVEEGEIVEYKADYLSIAGKRYLGKMLAREEVETRINLAEQNYKLELKNFVHNTLDYAAKELDIIIQKITLPPLQTSLYKRHVLIVVRGKNYREDLRAIRPYINEVRPALIGVDGGADALLEYGVKPDIIIGDMDSVTDNTLRCGAELIVHAYENGNAPGLERIMKMNLKAHLLACKGTSEDIAMLLAYEAGAELIVAVGSHSNIIDFLDKGRKGMASTFLVRLLVGTKLVDAKGVSQLYRTKLKLTDMVKILLAALIPFFIVVTVSPTTYQLIRLILIKFRLFFNL